MNFDRNNISKIENLTTLVVGGAGFIGSHLSNKLSESGLRTVIAIGRSDTPKFFLKPGVKYLSGDVRDEKFICSLLSISDEVIDLSFNSVPKTSFDDPVRDVMENLPTSVYLQKKASTYPLKCFLLVSSGGTVYGHVNAVPIKETHSTNPVSPYGISKLTTEKYAFLFHQHFNLPVVIVRPSNPYGPNQFGNLAQGFIGAAIRAVLSGKNIQVFGESGTVRDYIYIDDLVSGIMSALNHGEKGSIYNIGTGIGSSNHQIINRLADLFVRDSYDYKIEKMPARSFDVNQNVLDFSQLTKVSGWIPITDLSVGLESTWNWAKNNF